MLTNHKPLLSQFYFYLSNSAESELPELPVAAKTNYRKIAYQEEISLINPPWSKIGFYLRKETFTMFHSRSEVIEVLYSVLVSSFWIVDQRVI